MSHAGWLAAVLNFFGLAAAPPGGVLDGTFGVEPVLDGTFAAEAVLDGTFGVEPVLDGTFGRE